MLLNKISKVLVVTHVAREQAISAAIEVCELLLSNSVMPIMLREEKKAVTNKKPDYENRIAIYGDNDQSPEAAIVLGGDGTILRTAELVRHYQVPILGINLGHVGFLAEIERHNLADSVDKLISGKYEVEQRLTLDIQVTLANGDKYFDWALNDAAVEKNNRELMIEVVIEVDNLPLSSFGCDGVVLSTPTGSTAYSFSAGGPVVWPNVRAMVISPISAHALFSRPLVVDPRSSMAVELLDKSVASGVLICDGRRRINLPPGSRVEATRSDFPVLIARLSDSPFTTRLVNKFNLPVSGWRGPKNISH